MGRRTAENLFPSVLHGILEDAYVQGYEDVISWNATGKSFKVHDRNRFVVDILPKYATQTKYKSFVRQLNLWGFSCIHGGRKAPERGSYQHEYFLRDSPSMCRLMKRTKGKGSIMQHDALNFDNSAGADGNDSSRRQHSTPNPPGLNRTVSIIPALVSPLGSGQAAALERNGNNSCNEGAASSSVSNRSLSSQSTSTSDVDGSSLANASFQGVPDSAHSEKWADSNISNDCGGTHSRQPHFSAVGVLSNEDADNFNLGDYVSDADLLDALICADLVDFGGMDLPATGTTAPIALQSECSQSGASYSSSTSIESSTWLPVSSSSLIHSHQRKHSNILGNNGLLFTPVKTVSSGDTSFDPIFLTDDFWTC